MRHRINNDINLGKAPGTDYNLDNKWLEGETNQAIYEYVFADALNTFKLMSVADFGFIGSASIMIGSEPTYAGDNLYLIKIDLENKANSSLWTGHAFGPYGTGVCKTIKYYGDYKNKSKFIKFVDKWYDTLLSLRRK